MDPNYANLWNQMYSLSQHPSNSTSGMSLLEQAAIQTGLTPSFPVGHGMAGSQMLSDPSLMRTAQVSMPSAQPSSNLTNPPGTTTPRLPPFSNIKERSHVEVDTLVRDTSSVPSLAMGHSDVSKWSALFQDYGVRPSDPPPAHSGPSRPGSQMKNRAETDQLMDALLRRQMEPSVPPKAHQSQAQPQKYPEAYSSTSKYQEPVPKFSTPPIQKYQEPTAKYQEPVHQKCPDMPSDNIPGYLIQKAGTQSYREPDTGKLLQQEYGSHDVSSKYGEESLSRGASQLHRMMSSSEPSPQSHDSSPHMGLSSPHVSHHNSPQMTNSLIQDPHHKYTSYAPSLANRQYIVSSAPSAYSMNPHVSSATLHYEAVSPATQHNTDQMNYNTLNLESIHAENQVKVSTSHNHNAMLSMKIPSPPVHSNSPIPVASPTSTVQQVPSGPVRAQADSTTKSKRGGRRGGGRGGTRVGKSKKSKKEEESMQQMTGCLQMSTDGQHLPKQVPSMQMTSQPEVTMQQSMSGMLHSGSETHPGNPMMADINMPAYSSLVDTYGVNQYSDEAMLQVNVAQGMLGMMASPDLKSEQESILMNMNENRSQYMEEGQDGNVMAPLKQDPTQLVSHIASNTAEDNAGLEMSSVEAKRPKQKTKAELKCQPQEAEMDEEFGHLATSSNKSSETQHRPKLASKDSSFQSSFLSFLQGNKQETLSSVTNSSITHKPELPKYIPEPPRPKPKKQTPILEKLSNESKSLSSEMKIKPVTFSDNEDSSQGSSSVKLNQTVEGVISELGEEKTEKRYKSFLQTSPVTSKQEERSPLRLKIKMSDIKIPGTSSQKSPKTSKNIDSVNHKKLKSKHSRRGSMEDYYAEVVHVADEEGASDHSPPPVTRQRSSRKAKEKVEEKRKARLEKKGKKKKKKSVYVDLSDYSSAGDFFESEEEKDYDSDKDPVWMPGEKPQDVFSQDLDPEIRRKQQSLTKSKPPKSVRRRRKDSEDEDFEDESLSGKRPKHLGGSGSDIIPSSVSGTSTGTIKSKAVVMEECDSDDNSPHQYSKGNFVMEKKEMCNPDKFVIWKIDAGKLIQKYEPFVLDGKLVHKSLSTYSSWSDYFRPNYMGVQVRTISQMKNQEVVEVLEAYHPKKEDEKLESEEHMASFNVFVQILLSHSLEPGFLSLVKQHDDDYYTVPLQKMEDLLAEKKTLIGETLQWNPLFKETVEKYPLLRISEKDTVETSVRCQASGKFSSEVAVKTARLYGEPYHFDSLDKAPSGHLILDKAVEFHIGKTATKCLRQYHRLHHFKYRIYKKCLYMVDCCKRGPGKDTSELLDQCLQNRIWVQNLFHELKMLLDLPEISKSHKTRIPQGAEITETNQAADPAPQFTEPAQDCPAVSSSTSPQPKPQSAENTASSSTAPDTDLHNSFLTIPS